MNTEEENASATDMKRTDAGETVAARALLFALTSVSGSCASGPERRLDRPLLSSAEAHEVVQTSRTSFLACFPAPALPEGHMMSVHVDLEVLPSGRVSWSPILEGTQRGPDTVIVGNVDSPTRACIQNVAEFLNFRPSAWSYRLGIHLQVRKTTAVEAASTRDPERVGDIHFGTSVRLTRATESP